MTHLIKIGHVFLNLDRVETVEDLFSQTREDKIIVRFGPAEGQALTFTGRAADDLRTWLNATATNLHDAIERESGG